MTCSNCGTEYTQAGNSDEGYVRSICHCDREQKCFKCKRGDFHPVNQALLDLDFDVRYFACARHGHLEAESFPLPERLIEVKAPAKSSKKEPVKKKEPPPVTSTFTMSPWPSTDTVETYKSELVKSRELVTCLNCGVEQKFCHFDVRLGVSTIPVPYCPLCGNGRPKYSGKNW